MRTLLSVLAAMVAAALLLTACSGSTTSNSGDTLTPEVETPIEFPGDFGPIVDTEDGDKSVAYDFHHIWTDTVNHESYGRWTVTDNSGEKSWTLSNTCFSAPKAWIMGGNYWNRENDELMSKSFQVTGPAKDIRLSFVSRWQILDGDLGQVQFRMNGGPWLTMQMFTGGQNPNYPNWNKYYYTLPAVQTQTTYQLRFVFTSDTSGNAWGFGIDDVSVYQSLPEPPTGVTATDGDFTTKVQVTWLDSGYKVTPDSYNLYRADDQAGPYTFIANIPYGQTAYDDTNVNQLQTYWYRMTSVVDQIGESRPSEVDSGYADVP